MNLKSLTKKKVLVVGGAGYIGSHVNKVLAERGYETYVLDNLSRGHRAAVVRGEFIEGDLSDQSLLNRLFEEKEIDAVMHFAAFTDVGESVLDPAKYYRNNVTATLNLLEAMRKNRVSVFIFSSTAAIFGIPKEDRITELHSHEPINPYGQSKLIVERALADYDKAYGLKHSCLRYFNAAGGDPGMEIKYFPRKESNLIPLALKSLKQPEAKLTIFGSDYPTRDGTCVRDYIHINDLADAHIKAMEQIFTSQSSTVYNLGNGQGFTVKEVISAVESVTGLKVNAQVGPRRPGDPPHLVADSAKAKKELGWKPRFSSLEEMIDHAWRAMN